MTALSVLHTSTGLNFIQLRHLRQLFVQFFKTAVPLRCGLSFPRPSICMDNTKTCMRLRLNLTRYRNKKEQTVASSVDAVNCKSSTLSFLVLHFEGVVNKIHKHATS